MKQVTRQLLALILFCAFSSTIYSQAETNTEFSNRMNYVFSPLEKNRVPHGLLLDYAVEFADLKSYNGVLTDSNKVNAGLLKDVYTTLLMSGITINAGSFYHPDYIDSLWQEQRQPGIITLSGLYYNYARFKDNAVSSNLITVSNDQFYDRYVSGVWQNPYQTESVFAMSPPLHAYSGKNFQVVLPSNLWLTNNAGSVRSLAVDFNDGGGYRPITAGQAMNISYADTGTKTWTFKLTLTNSTIFYSHTQMQIKPEPNAYSGSGGSGRFARPGGPVFLTADNDFGGQFGQGWITVDYANDIDPVLNRHRLLRPLIVVEGFDPGHLLNPEQQFGETNFNSFFDQVRFSGSNDFRNLLQGATQQYDIIYVDWARGTDFLQRNALLLERVIRWVNEQKALDGSNEPNVVLGQSMGGVISRWALRDMENRGLNHQTRLYISWDAPHLGANVPVAYQHLARHARNIYISFNGPGIVNGYNYGVRPFVNGAISLANTVRGLFGGTPWNELGSLPSNSQILSGLNLMDLPAARQMLINRINLNGVINNNLHDAWQTELRNLGYPQQSRNVAVSNGSECGVGQGFPAGATLLNVVGKANTRFVTDMLGTIGMPILGIATTQPAFLLGIVPGRNELNFNFRCEAQPDGPVIEIYKGNITYKKKLFWLVNVTTTLTNRTRNSDPSVLPIDGTPGGMYDTELRFQSSSVQNWAVKYNLTVYNIPHFNFIPTVSALDIGSGNTALTINEYRAGYVGATPPAAPFNTQFDNFTTAYNQVNVSNGTNNNNENHIQIATRNGNFAAEELNGNLNVRTNCSAYCSSTEIAGNYNVCGVTVYSVPLVPGATYTWFPFSSSLATFTASGNNLTVTRNGTAKGFITITVFITSTCGTDIQISRNIEIGSNLEPPVFGGMPNSLCQRNTFNVYAAPGYNNYAWSAAGGAVISGQGTNQAYISVDDLPQGQTSGTMSVLLQVLDNCNEQLTAVRSSSVSSCTGGGIDSRAKPDKNLEEKALLKTLSQVQLYPNPASNYFILELPDAYTGTSIKLLTQQGQFLRQEKITNKLTKVNVQELTAGVYIVEIITKNGKAERRKLILVR